MVLCSCILWTCIFNINPLPVGTGRAHTQHSYWVSLGREQQGCCNTQPSLTMYDPEACIPEACGLHPVGMHHQQIYICFNIKTCGLHPIGMHHQQTSICFNIKIVIKQTLIKWINQFYIFFHHVQMHVSDHKAQILTPSLPMNSTAPHLQFHWKMPVDCEGQKGLKPSLSSVCILCIVSFSAVQFASLFYSLLMHSAKHES